jgi:hypothetical protein
MIESGLTESTFSRSFYRTPVEFPDVSELQGNDLLLNVPSLEGLPAHSYRSPGGSKHLSLRPPRNSSRNPLGHGASFRSSCGEFAHTGGGSRRGRGLACIVSDVSWYCLNREKFPADSVPSSKPEDRRSLLPRGRMPLLAMRMRKHRNAIPMPACVAFISLECPLLQTTPDPSADLGIANGEAIAAVNPRWGVSGTDEGVAAALRHPKLRKVLAVSRGGGWGEVPDRPLPWTPAYEGVNRECQS